MPNYVTNMIHLFSGDIDKALKQAKSDTSVFSLDSIQPVKKGLDIFDSKIGMCSLANHIYSLGMSDELIIKLLTPVEYYLNLEKIQEYHKMYKELVKTNYDDQGNLITDSSELPEPKAEYQDLGARLYLQLVNYGTILERSSIGRKCEAEAATLEGTLLKFHTETESPFTLVDAWAQKHQLSMTYKALEDGCHWWYVATFKDGVLIEKRMSDRADLRPLLKELNDLTDEEIEENYFC